MILVNRGEGRSGRPELLRLCDKTDDRAHPGLVEFIGEVDEHEKDELLAARGLPVFPVDWPEPFGLTMAEAMATGTPVIATHAGSVPEVVDHGKTGFVCDTLAGMIRRGRARRRQSTGAPAGNTSSASARPAAIAAGYERILRGHRRRALHTPRRARCTCRSDPDRWPTSRIPKDAHAHPRSPAQAQ